jgi:hypothetical protein
MSVNLQGIKHINNIQWLRLKLLYQAVVWEPTARIYLVQPFNITEAASIARDLVSDARNYSYRVNDSGHVEEIDVRHFVAKFTALNVNLNQAIDIGKPAAGNFRTKRNIFGNVLSSLTGLVTEEGRALAH